MWFEFSHSFVWRASAVFVLIAFLVGPGVGGAEMTDEEIMRTVSVVQASTWEKNIEIREETWSLRVVGIPVGDDWSFAGEMLDGSGQSMAFLGSLGKTGFVSVTWSSEAFFLGQPLTAWSDGWCSYFERPGAPGKTVEISLRENAQWLGGLKPPEMAALFEALQLKKRPLIWGSVALAPFLQAFGDEEDQSQERPPVTLQEGNDPMPVPPMDELLRRFEETNAALEAIETVVESTFSGLGS